MGIEAEVTVGDLVGAFVKINGYYYRVEGFSPRLGLVTCNRISSGIRYLILPEELIAAWKAEYRRMHVSDCRTRSSQRRVV